MSDCPSCNGLNTSCPDGCGRDPLTGELNGTRYTRPAANVEAEPVADLPADVRRLVIAARIVAFEDRGPEALHELDLASEAFADRVPWENEDEG